MAVKFLAPEDEELVLLDRATSLIAEVVVAVDFGLVRLVVRQFTLLIEVFVGIQAIIAVEEAAVAMPLIGAALGDQGNLSAGRLAELRLVVRGQDLYFLDRIQIDGDMGPAVVACVHVRRAVNGEFVLVGARAIDVVGIQAARGGLVCIERPRHSRDELHIVEHVAAVESDCIDLLPGDHIGTLARIGLQLHLANVRSDADGIGCCSNGQYQFAGVQFGSGTQHKSRRLQLLEPRRLNFDGVGSGVQSGRGELTAI